MNEQSYETVGVHLAGADPGILTDWICVESKLENVVSLPTDKAPQQLLPRVDPASGHRRLAILVPHGAPGGGNPNGAFGWIGFRNQVGDQVGAYAQGTGQGPIYHHGPEELWVQADPTSTVNLGVSVYAYYFERR